MTFELSTKKGLFEPIEIKLDNGEMIYIRDYDWKKHLEIVALESKLREGDIDTSCLQAELYTGKPAAYFKKYDPRVVWELLLYIKGKMGKMGRAEGDDGNEAKNLPSPEPTK